jgi:hypothetical protein
MNGWLIVLKKGQNKEPFLVNYPMVDLLNNGVIRRMKPLPCIV